MEGSATLVGVPPASSSPRLSGKNKKVVGEPHRGCAQVLPLGKGDGLPLVASRAAAALLDAMQRHSPVRHDSGVLAVQLRALHSARVPVREQWVGTSAAAAECSSGADALFLSDEPVLALARLGASGGVVPVRGRRVCHRSELCAPAGSCHRSELCAPAGSRRPRRQQSTHQMRLFMPTATWRGPSATKAGSTLTGMDRVLESLTASTTEISRSEERYLPG